MKYTQLVIFFFCCICLGLYVFFCSNTIQAETISVLTQKGTIPYSVEIADTPALQQQGLMYRKNMPQNEGMVFAFKKSKLISMWMKNTYIPLDMLFVDEKGIIRHIHENARPFDETVISSPIPVKYVIELNAGQVKANDIRISNQVILNLKDKI